MSQICGNQLCDYTCSFLDNTKVMVEVMSQIGFHMITCFWRYSGKFFCTVTGCGNYTKGSIVRRKCGVGDRNISHFTPAIPVSAHREGNVCSSFSPSHAPV